jgi:gliding motility-associated-like protein
MKQILLTLLIFYFFAFTAFAQPCSLPGMTPSSAIPVCGTTPFVQPQLANCTGDPVAIRGCTDNATSDRAFWYKFTCYQTGTLGFVIRGVNVNDDYDWCLFDITGRNPNEVFTNNTLQVSLNLYGIGGEPSPPFPQTPTGCIPGGSGDVHCSGAANTNTPFNRMPTITAGREYLLMVNNFTNSTDGYTLTFTGGTASITDPLLPRLSRASSACDTRQVRVKLNKKMKCSSLAANGSDFTINAPGNSIVSATGIGCSNGFDMDSVILTMANPLPAGNYIVTAATGTDNNTLLDYCDRNVPVGDNIPLVIAPLIPTPMDSLTRPGCAPVSLNLVFSKSISCSSVAADGTDFIITGPTPVTVVSAAGTCTNGFSGNITVQLGGPIQVGGTYRIRLQNGTDANTLLDECSLQTPAGSFIDFVVADTVNAGFTYSIVYGCAQNTVQYNHPGANGINSWQWNFDGIRTSSLQNPLISYTDFRVKNTSLIVSNGVCRDTAAVSIFFDNLLIAAFEGPEFACPNEPATFVNQSEGTISSYQWSFGSGITSVLENPLPVTYPVPMTTRDETVRLIVRNSFGCADTATHTIKVVNNCYIAVPSAFTPNNDGLNDYLYPLNAYKAKDLTFSVYNRFGQRIFFTRNWLDKWDGNFKGQGADPGTYVWTLQYIHTDTNLRVEQKGTVILIR